MSSSQSAPVALPRVAITYCTQCRWMLRAAYFAQELLTTFSTLIGEVALIPATGGLFTVDLTYIPSPTNDSTTSPPTATKVLLWDRKEKGGFPETKVLKQLVRDHIDPGKDLGHSDRHGKKKTEEVKSELEAKDEKSKEQTTDESSVPTSGGRVEVEVKKNPDGTVCEDCR